MSELAEAVTVEISEQEVDVGVSEIDDFAKEKDKEEEVCMQIASAACNACAIQNSCPILKLRSPDVRPATPENILDDTDDVLVAIIPAEQSDRLVQAIEVPTVDPVPKKTTVASSSVIFSEPTKSAEPAISEVPSAIEENEEVQVAVLVEKSPQKSKPQQVTIDAREEAGAVEVRLATPPEIVRSITENTEEQQFADPAESVIVEQVAVAEKPPTKVEALAEPQIQHKAEPEAEPVPSAESTPAPKVLTAPSPEFTVTDEVVATEEVKPITKESHVEVELPLVEIRKPQQLAADAYPEELLEPKPQFEPESEPKLGLEPKQEISSVVEKTTTKPSTTIKNPHDTDAPEQLVAVPPEIIAPEQKARPLHEEEITPVQIDRPKPREHSDDEPVEVYVEIAEEAADTATQYTERLPFVEGTVLDDEDALEEGVVQLNTLQSIEDSPLQIDTIAPDSPESIHGIELPKQEQVQTLTALEYPGPTSEIVTAVAQLISPEQEEVSSEAGSKEEPAQPEQIIQLHSAEEPQELTAYTSPTETDELDRIAIEANQAVPVEQEHSQEPESPNAGYGISGWVGVLLATIALRHVKLRVS